MQEFCRLGILVDFLSHSTITGFMAGSATIVCLQQFKGILGLKRFTGKTDIFSVVKCLIDMRKEVRLFVFRNELSDILFPTKTHILT